MNLLARTKRFVLRTKQAWSSLSALQSVSGSLGWYWPYIRELTTGGWQRNEDVAIDTALSHPKLFAIVTLIAGDIAKLRPMVVERDNDRVWNEIDSPAFSPVLRKPNAYQTHVDFFEWWMLSKLVHGNTYALKARDGRSVVTALYILDPYRVTPLQAPDGSLFYQLSPDVLAQIERSVVVPAREIIHDKMTPLFHPLLGVSPLYAAGFPAVQGLSTRRASEKFFSNGSKPGGVLVAPGTISQATADRLKAYWESNFSGDNIGKIAVLGDGLKYEPMAMSAEQSRLVEQLNLSDEDIAACFHMPRHKVGIGPDPTYNNIAALNQQYYTDCLQALIVKLQEVLREGLGLDAVPGRTLSVEFDLDDLLLMDGPSRIKAGADAIGSGGLSPNEARFRYFDVGPVKGGETPYLQNQMWPLPLLADRPTPANPAPAAPTLPEMPIERMLPPQKIDRDLFWKEYHELEATA